LWIKLLGFKMCFLSKIELTKEILRKDVEFGALMLFSLKIFNITFQWNGT
jgi:hypothetical protein